MKQWKKLWMVSTCGHTKCCQLGPIRYPIQPHSTRKPDGRSDTKQANPTNEVLSFHIGVVLSARRNAHNLYKISSVLKSTVKFMHILLYPHCLFWEAGKFKLHAWAFIPLLARSSNCTDHSFSIAHHALRHAIIWNPPNLRSPITPTQNP